MPSRKGACSAEEPEHLGYQSLLLAENLSNTKFTLPGNIRRNNHTFFTVFLTSLVDDEHFVLFLHTKNESFFCKDIYNDPNRE